MTGRSVHAIELSRPMSTSRSPAGRRSPATTATLEPAQKPRAEQPPKLSDVKLVIEVMRQCGGIKSAAAQTLHVSRPTLYAFLKEHPEAQQASADIDEELLDIAEAQVVKSIKAAEMQTVRWYLELKGKERGYVRRVEQTGKGGGPVETRQSPDLSGYSEVELAQLLSIEEARQKREDRQAK
jgi:hypothetical protein